MHRVNVSSFWYWRGIMQRPRDSDIYSFPRPPEFIEEIRWNPLQCYLRCSFLMYVAKKCPFYSCLLGGGVDRHIRLNGQQYGWTQTRTDRACLGPNQAPGYQVSNKTKKSKGAVISVCWRRAGENREGAPSRRWHLYGFTHVLYCTHLIAIKLNTIIAAWTWAVSLSKSRRVMF